MKQKNIVYRIQNVRGSVPYEWTSHARFKLRFYGLSEHRIERVIRFPKRIEEGIVPDTVAVMQPAGTKRYQEIWAMYSLTRAEKRGTQRGTTQKIRTKNSHSKIKIITVWRYPGKSPARNPIPAEIINEIGSLL